MGTITMNYGEAIADALKIEMRRDPNVYISGEDVGKFGGSFGVTGYGVFTEFPDRVLDTPISETAIVGTRRGRGGGGAAAVRGDPLHGLPADLHGRALQPGGQGALHVRWTAEVPHGGADRAGRRHGHRRPPLAVAWRL